MTREVHQDVAVGVGEEAFGARDCGVVASSQQPQKGLHRHLRPAVVHLDGGPVQVEAVAERVEDLSAEGVARVAGHVVCQHEDDAVVRDAEAADSSADRCRRIMDPSESSDRFLSRKP